MRLALLLIALPIFACIERTPTADDERPLDCAPQDCGAAPDLARCPDDTAPTLTCEAQDGVCAWAIARCAEPEPEPPSVEPEPVVECAPEACGLTPDGGGCAPGFEVQYDCVADVDGCAWAVDCAPIEPRACGVDECGAQIPGEPCGPDERSVQECRDTPDGCAWYVACEPIECGPADCPDDPPLPNCEHTLACAPMDGGCGWLAECVAPVCEQPWDPGTCRALQPVWWFNSDTQACEQRDYGGCEGNENRFETEADCFAACGALGK